MQRNWNIIRALILDLTDEIRDWHRCLSPGWSADIVWDHALILQDGGFITGIPTDEDTIDDGAVRLVDVRVTWSGHEMADLLREQAGWDVLALSMDLENFDGVTYPVIREYLENRDLENLGAKYIPE